MIIAGLRAILATTSDPISRAVLGEAISAMGGTAREEPVRVRRYEIGADGEVISSEPSGGILVPAIATSTPTPLSRPS